MAAVVRTAAVAGAGVEDVAAAAAAVMVVVVVVLLLKEEDDDVNSYCQYMNLYHVIIA